MITIYLLLEILFQQIHFCKVYISNKLSAFLYPSVKESLKYASLLPLFHMAGLICILIQAAKAS